MFKALIFICANSLQCSFVQGDKAYELDVCELVAAKHKMEVQEKFPELFVTAMCVAKGEEA